MAIIWKLQTFDISELKELNKNPRRITKEQYEHLKSSLTKFGLIDKPVVTEEGLIIGGHQRIKVLEFLGEDEVECYIPSKKLTDKEIEELNVRLNKNAGEWDYDILANEWEAEDLLDWGFFDSELGIDADSLLLEASKDDKPKKCTVSFTFSNVDDLNNALPEFDMICDKYPKTNYSVRIK